MKFFFGKRQVESLFIGVVVMAPIAITPVVTLAQTFGEGALADDSPIDSTSNDISLTVSPFGSVLIDQLVNSFVNSRVAPLNVASFTDFSNAGCATPATNQSQQYFLQRINQNAGIPSSFVPDGLVNVTSFVNTRHDATVCLTDATAHAWISLVSDASREGKQFTITSGYRNAGNQAALFTEYAPLYNQGQYKRVAAPGHSEHQLGTTLDIASVSSGYKAGYALVNTPEWEWMQQNAYKYGFVNSYHRGAEHLTGYHFEPWHWRYVGKDVAMMLRVFNHSLAFVQDYRSPATLIQSLSTNILTQSNQVGVGG